MSLQLTVHTPSQNNPLMFLKHLPRRICPLRSVVQRFWHTGHDRYSEAQELTAPLLQMDANKPIKHFISRCLHHFRNILLLNASSSCKLPIIFLIWPIKSALQIRAAINQICLRQTLALARLILFCGSKAKRSHSSSAFNDPCHPHWCAPFPSLFWLLYDRHIIQLSRHSSVRPPRDTTPCAAISSH